MIHVYAHIYIYTLLQLYNSTYIHILQSQSNSKRYTIPKERLGWSNPNRGGLKTQFINQEIHTLL